MKSIKKLKESSKAVAGTALLVGATLAGGAAFATAQDSGSSGNLGDYPAPFVDDNGEVSSTIVMGEDAASIDVVAASDIAGQLGNDAFSTETVSAGSGATAGTWTAENGITLNRQSTDLFMYEGSGQGITRIDDSDVDTLAPSTFQSADSNEVEVEHDVEIADQPQQFEAEGDYDNPILHLNNPSSVDDQTYLFSATAEFSDSIDFTTAGDSANTNDADEYLEDGDTIELFGTEYTFSDESDGNDLTFYGNSDRVEVSSSEESTTVTVNGEEVSLGTSYVNDGGGSATVIVNGQTESIEEGDTVGPNGNIRVSDIFRTGPDGAGTVAFSQGSDELVITDSNTVELDGEEVDGVYVDFSAEDNNNEFGTMESMTFYFGAQDNDDDFIEAGDMYEDPVFGLQFHYGGLNPDTADAENAAETVEVDAPEDDVAEVSFTTADDEEVTVPVHTYESDTDGDEYSFGTEDGTIAQYEGQAVEEDDMVVLNAFEEAGLYEVTDVSDSDLTESVDDAEVSVTLENVATGDSVEVSEDGLDFTQDTDVHDESEDTATLKDESIEGKDFDVSFEGNEQVSFVRSTAGSERQVLPWMYTSTDSAVAFDASGTETGGDSVIDLSKVFPNAGSQDQTIELPSGIVSNDATATVTFNNGDATGVTVDSDFVQYDGELSVSNGNLVLGDDSTDDSKVLVTQPENDDDQEEAYIIEANSEGSGSADVGTYTGEETSKVTLDDEDVTVNYDEFGAYVADDEESSDTETLTLNMPGAQATSGFAFTGPDGSLSADGSSSGGDVETMSPTGWSTSYTALDSDNTVSSAKQDSNLILVGGPSVNSLVGELVEANETMEASEYTEGQGMIQLVEDAFTEGNDALVVAGYAGEDTRQAGEFLANYEQNSEALEGQDKVSINTAEGTVVQ